MNRILLVVVCIAQAVVGNVEARLPLHGVRRRRGRLPDVPAARRGRVPRLPLLIWSFPIIIIMTSSAFRGSLNISSFR